MSGEYTSNKRPDFPRSSQKGLQIRVVPTDADQGIMYFLESPQQRPPRTDPIQTGTSYFR